MAACSLEGRAGLTGLTGWIRSEDLELASRLEKARPGRDEGVLLSPFDPLLWDRKRVQMLFAFEQMLEIFKPAHQRKYGYYCMPVLVGDELVGRCDLKGTRRLRVCTSYPSITRVTDVATPCRRASRATPTRSR